MLDKSKKIKVVAGDVSEIDIWIMNVFPMTKRCASYNMLVLIAVALFL